MKGNFRDPTVELRQCARNSLPVFIRLIDALARLVPAARTDNQLDALEKHAGILRRTAERVTCDEADMEDIETRLDALDKSLAAKRG